MTGEHIAVLAKDDECLKALMLLTAEIRNGTLPDSVREFLVACRMLFTHKGETVRPLAVVATLYRLAGITATEDVGEQAAARMYPVQLGVGVRGGPELAAQMLQALLLGPAPPDEEADHPWRGQELAGCAADFVNAFNEADRARMLTRVFAEPSFRLVWRFVHWSYKRPAILIALTKPGELAFQLLSQQGVRQGDAMGCFLFAWTIHNTILRALQGTSVRAIAILDDINFVGPATELPTVVRNMKEYAREDKLTLSGPKTKYLWFHDSAPPPALQEASVADAIEIVSLKELIGCPIGHDRAAVHAALTSKVSEHERFFRVLLEDSMPTQCAFILLRASGVPRFNYLNRTSLPQDTRMAARSFDALVVQTLARKLGVDPESLSDATRALIRLPARHGGAGLISQEEIGPLAFLGSLAQAAYLLNDPMLRARVCANPLLRQALEEMEGRIEALDDARHLLPDDRSLPGLLDLYGNEQLVRAHRPATVAPTVPAPPPLPPRHRQVRGGGGPQARRVHPAEHLQRLLSSELHSARQRALLGTLPLAHRVAVQSAGGTHGSAWLNAIPTDPLTTMSDEEYRVALHIRMRHPPATLMSHCVCDGRIDVSDAQNHYLGCPQLMHSTGTYRHNMVTQALASVFRRAGASVQVEAPTGVGFRRFDILAIFAHRTLALDVSVPHPTCRTYLAARRLTEEGAVAARAEAAKATAYAAEARDVGAAFHPFVIESYGHFGRSASALLRSLTELRAEITPPSSLSESTLLSLAVTACSIAVQRGNAACYREGNVRARERAATRR